MFDTDNTHPAALDTLFIEAEARRLRAEFFSSSIRAAGRWLVAMFTVRPRTGAQH